MNSPARLRLSASATRWAIACAIDGAMVMGPKNPTYATHSTYWRRSVALRCVTAVVEDQQRHGLREHRVVQLDEQQCQGGLDVGAGGLDSAK
jgi:hypothetical protein